MQKEPVSSWKLVLSAFGGKMQNTFLVTALFVLTTPPDAVIILHQGAFCLLCVFTGSVQILEQAFLKKRFVLCKKYPPKTYY